MTDSPSLRLKHQHDAQTQYAAAQRYASQEPALRQRLKEAGGNGH